MTDKGDLDKTIRLKSQTLQEAPYKFDGDYSASEYDKLQKFMHENFPHVKLGGARDKGIIVEYPPSEICGADEWKDILTKVLLPEWETFEPATKRGSKIIIRFVNTLYDNEKNVEAGGNCMTVAEGEWCRIRYKSKAGKMLDKENLTFVLMHELAETDFWKKTLPGDEEANVSGEEEIKAFTSQGQEYRDLLDEKIANRRAMRAIKRAWPNAFWIDPDDVYDEDR